MKNIYKSIPKDITNNDLTIVIQFVVKILNKYKSPQGRETIIQDLPGLPEKKLLDICDKLLNEINLDDIDGQDEKIDEHILALFEILKISLKEEVDKEPTKGKELLDFFMKNN